MNDISGFGFRINLIASNTFPNGIMVSQFADDADPFDTPSIQIADKAMGLNGDLVAWSAAVPLEITLNVIPDSEDDVNLATLAEANRVSKGKSSAQDKITMVGIYPEGNTRTFSFGRLTNAVPASSIASSGRRKSKAYSFTFEQMAVS